MSLYTELKDAGCTLDSHESDLYVKATPEAEAIILAWRAAGVGSRHVITFLDSINGERWFEIPFMYDPWWYTSDSRKENNR
jgi:hypothetical protein